MAIEAETGNQRTLAWLESAREYAREEGRARLGELLETVREEVIFEEEISGVPSQVWRMVGSDGRKECQVSAGFSALARRGPGCYGLSERQVEVLLLVSRGLSNRQVAIVLGLSEATVKRHLSNIYGRLGVLCRSAAVRKALAEGWISVSSIVREDGGQRTPAGVHQISQAKKPGSPGGKTLRSA